MTNDSNIDSSDSILRTDRRAFMGTCAGLAGAAVLGGLLPQPALAARRGLGTPDVLVSIFLRGGVDALTTCAPYGDPFYATSRTLNRLSPPSSGTAQAAIDLDGFFGFHPALAPLMPAYAASDLLVVQATGTTSTSRSHFEKERIMEVADDTGASGTGWIGRHLASAPPVANGALLRGVGIRTDLPYSLGGGPLVLPIPVLQNFGLYGSTSTEAARKAVLATMYSRQADPLKSNAVDALAVMSLMQSVGFASYQPAPGAVYPSTGPHAAFGQGLRATAALIKAQIGVEAIALDLRDFDTHGQQGTFGGTLHGLLDALALSLGAFYTDITTGTAPGVTVVVMSEFGRRVPENASGGTDHGHGGMMMLLGNGGIDGGRVLSSWPGLAPGQLFEGIDLAVTIDHRDVLAEVVQNRLGNTNLGAVFPAYAPTFRGVTI